MKAILEFNLPDDDQEFKLATNALSFWVVLYGLDQYLRESVKYAPDTVSEEAINTFQFVRDKLYELMGENNISLDMVE